MGAKYDLERFERESGLSTSLNDTLKGWVSVRHVKGSANAVSPTGGGEINARALGPSLGGSWRNADNYYAAGCFSFMDYDIDFSSNQMGLLNSSVDASVYSLDFEAGRRLAMGKQIYLTPRMWIGRSGVSVDSFTDSVNSRVSFEDTTRIIGRLGVLAETVRALERGEEFALRGSIDFERMLRGAATRTDVSGERLSAEATENSLLFALNGVYQQGRFTVGAEIALREELGSDDGEYSSFLNLGIKF